jgi:hypothetical protein
LKHWKRAFLIFAPIFASACAGPSTPLGAVWAVHPNQVTRTLQSVEEPPSVTIGVPGVKIDFKPNHQVLHGPKPLMVRIEDPAGLVEHPKLRVRYDGLDVTKTFLSQAIWTFKNGDHELLLRIPVIRLSPNTEHRIEVKYYDAKGAPSFAAYRPPVCRTLDNKLVRHTDSFTPEIALLTLIESLSLQSNLNPALITGLIAQESSFNPRTVSWAKAMGLTQMTPIAEDAVSDQIEGFEKWPHYKGIDSLSASIIKMMVLAGRINESNDWKLNKETSIRGGLAYIQMLQKRWSSPEMTVRYDEIERTKLILASYNSGSARVQAALNHYGKEWLTAPELREARKYVNRIFSFCDFFSQDPKDSQDTQDTMTQIQEVDDENQT